MNLLENYAGTQCNYLLQRAQRSFKPLGTIHWNIFMSNVRYHVCSLSQLTIIALVENNGILELRVYPLDNSSIHVLWSKVNQWMDVGKTLKLARLMTNLLANCVNDLASRYWFVMGHEWQEPPSHSSRAHSIHPQVNDVAWREVAIEVWLSPKPFFFG